MLQQQTKPTFRVSVCGLIAFFNVGGLGLCSPNPTLAQVIPDTTLGTESTQVSQIGNSFLIQAGATRGTNLFHSFSSFSVGAGQTARFSPAPSIQTIFSRVTGSNPSNIFGTLRVDGTASLFLINPNGILFGPNARLNVGGSFVATTANGVVFPNGDRFSATNPERPSPLLTVNPSALFVNQLKPAPITVRGQLTVPNGKSLVFAGGNVQLDGATLTASGGRIEIGGLAAPGLIGLGSSDFKLSFPSDASRANAVINQALLDVRSGTGGDIGITVQNLDVSNGSLAAGVSQKTALGKAQAGDITINATGTVNIGQGSNIFSDVSSQEQGRQIRGKGGRILVTAKDLSVQSGSEINTNTFGIGDAGSITIQVTDGVSLGETTGIRSQVLNTAIGNGGKIQIQARSLSLEKGADIATSVLRNGTGDAGGIDIQVSDSITISGASSTRLQSGGSAFASGLRVNHDSTGSGNGGNITLQTGKLILTDGGLIEATTTAGDGGNITLTAQDYVLLRRGSSISTSAGKIGAGGDGGNITILAPFVLAVLSENSDIRANAFTGSGGNITITAQGIYGLKFQTQNTIFSDITASSQFGLNGTITLNTPNLDPSRSLVALTASLSERTDQMGLGCAAQGKLAKRQNRFSLTGRGGMPTNPDEMFMGSDRPLVDPIDPVEATQTQALPPQIVQPQISPAQPPQTTVAPGGAPSQPQIIEAQGWIVDANGVVHLVAEAPIAESAQPGFISDPCRASQSVP